MKTIPAAVLAVGCLYLVNCKVDFNAPVKIKWVWVNTRKGSSPRITQNLEPAGYGGPGNSSYICRAKVIDHQGIKLWVPGKLIGGYCYAHHDKPHATFQIPDIPLSVTSWIPLPQLNRKLPSKAIIGGNHWDGVNAFICRGYIWNANRYVVPGTYHPNLNVCFIPFDGKERRWIDDTEILAINAYGVSLGLTDDRKK